MLRRSAMVSPLLLLLSCAVKQTADEPLAEDPPPAPREFRAAWVASVANIDWPSRSNLTVAEQKFEIKLMLDHASGLKLNAIVLQVRPAADALYPSTLEPWSEYLTGRQGKAPEPFYDPLKMWIDEAHLRGIELHAWLNPYRARHPSAKSALAGNHISVTHPWAVKQYGDVLWMDPAEPAAVKRTLDVVADLVRRYDVDGIHIDDYFYPYPVTVADGTELEFPDQPAWQRYLSSNGESTRADWRREQVNKLIEQMAGVIHREKSWVRFGISPFGLGRPERRPAGITGFSQYDKLYADAELWLGKGWLDYLAPQLYWPIDQAAQAFPVLLETWARENRQSRHLWPGLFTSRIDGSPKSWQPEEIARQIALTREHARASGHIHFSMIALLQDRHGIATLLKAGPYANAALVPATPWLGAKVPDAPRLSLQSSGNPNAPDRVLIETVSDPSVNRFSIWKRYGSKWVFSVQAASRIALTINDDPALGKPDAIVVSSVSRLGIESARTTLQLRP
ncbi:MAG: family 10 glycosylhydrolase [Comamonadaceae bacterium]